MTPFYIFAAANVAVTIAALLIQAARHQARVWRIIKEDGAIRERLEREVYELKKRAYAAEMQYPAFPEVGTHEWTTDFADPVPTLVRARVLKVEGKYDVEFIRYGDTFPIAGEVITLNVLVPHSCQEC